MWLQLASCVAAIVFLNSCFHASEAFIILHNVLRLQDLQGADMHMNVCVCDADEDTWLLAY